MKWMLAVVNALLEIIVGIIWVAIMIGAVVVFFIIVGAFISRL